MDVFGTIRCRHRTKKGLLLIVFMINVLGNIVQQNLKRVSFRKNLVTFCFIAIEEHALTLISEPVSNKA